MFLRLQDYLVVLALVFTSCNGVTALSRRSQNAPDKPAALSLNESGKHVYIVCFYGANDHDGLARKTCDEMIEQCRIRYGAEFCHEMKNPKETDVEAIPKESIVIVVTHTTPGSRSPDIKPNTDCTIDIWDSALSPPQVAKCGAPIVWFGCYGAQIAKECSNVIPLQDEPMVLDSRDPTIQCRFKATMLCLEDLTRRGIPITQQSIAECVARKVIDLTNKRDPLCPRQNSSGSGGGFR